MLGKSGQIQIKESIIVVFLFSIICGLLLIGFFRYTDSSIKKDIERYEMQRFETQFFTAVNPKIECTGKLNCFDGIKLLYYEPSHYSMVFTQAYPKTSEKIICTENNYPECNYYMIGDEIVGARLKTLVLVYDPINSDYKPYFMEVIK